MQVTQNVISAQPTAAQSGENAKPPVNAAPDDKVITNPDGSQVDAITIIENGQRINTRNSFLVQLPERPKFNDIMRMPRGGERKQIVWDRLVATADTSQTRVLDVANALKDEGIVDRVERYVTPNMVVVQAASSGKSREVLGRLQAIDGIKAIYNAGDGRQYDTSAVDGPKLLPPSSEPAWGLDVVPGSAKDVELPPINPKLGGSGGGLAALEPEWGVSMVGAPEAWKTGATGKGMVFGSIDTGADWDHEALKHAYRGYDAETGEVNHDYSWYDADRGARRSAEPKDSHGHGTHTIGSVLGRTETRAFGVAPEAKFIAAHALTRSMGTEGILRAIEFMQAPTKTDGSAPDPTKAPDAVGMSFWNGKNHQFLYQDALRNLQAAGIEPVKSNGNRGPNPESGTSPGQYPEITSTAAVDKDGEIAKFSSRGPSAMPHTGTTPLWKPDFAAPGVNVISAVPGDKYRGMSGTSMAQPHMSGVILSILSKHPNLDPNQLRKVIASGSKDAGARGRDLEFGWGITHIPGALSAAQELANAGEVAGVKPQLRLPATNPAHPDDQKAADKPVDVRPQEPSAA